MIEIGIGFVDDLISKVGIPLVSKGIKALTGIDIESKELTAEDKQKIMDSQIEIMKIDFEKLKLETESKLQSKKMILDDKSNARDRETKVTQSTGKRDYALISLAVVIVIGFFAGLVSLVFVTLDKGSGTYELLYMMFGALITKFGTVVDYFFGSSDK
jgi:hypothetical protein